LHTPIRRAIAAAHAPVAPLTPEAPNWVSALLPLTAAARHPVSISPYSDGIDVVARGDLLRARIALDDARAMDPRTLSAAVRDAYLAIWRFVRERGRHPIRLWNFVPGIGDRFGDLDRYMVFNRGRFEAFAELDARPPTSSGVGIASDDLVVEVLAATAAGTPVENPRQISSWKYSPCYGPRPPCFARATIAALDDRPWLLIGGTASIVGEDSCHADHLEAQLDETFANVCALIESVMPRHSDPIALVEDVRVYVARPQNGGEITEAVQRRFSGAREIEVAIASVCRPELLVEIEGRVRLTPRRA
jgi:chorismate lyase/3-hydroxybenzoate synthase